MILNVICLQNNESGFNSPFFTQYLKEGTAFIVKNLKDTFNEVCEKAQKENANEFIKSLPSIFKEKLSASKLYLVATFDTEKGVFTNDMQLLATNLYDILESEEKEKNE